MKGPSGESVSREWEGQTVVCIASGPSLSKEQIEASKGFRTIVVNDNYLVVPWAEVLYFADEKWWKWHKEGIQKNWSWASFQPHEVKKAFQDFKGQKVTIKHNPMATDADILSLQNLGPDGLSENPKGIMTGSNSGYQALNIAFLSGAKTILLLGYDMRFPGGKSHAHNGHPVKQTEGAYMGYAKRFNSTTKTLEKHGVRVVNCTPGSSIDCFERGKIESFSPYQGSPVVSPQGV